MPWGEGAGSLPPMRPVTGADLIHLVQESSIHRLVGADELEAGPAAEPWHDFADLFRDVLDSVADVDAGDLTGLAEQINIAIRDLQASGARVFAGRGGQILLVAVTLGDRRSLPTLFASG